MALKLVPDEDETITEDQARAYLLALSTPPLEAWRVSVRTLKTSDLLGLAGNPELLAYKLTVSLPPASERDQEILMAAMLALSEEIDRRIPIPT